MTRNYKLGDIAEIGRGSSPRPITDEIYFNGGTIPWVKISDATSSGKYIYETREHVNEYGASFSRILEPRTLITAASGVSLGFSKFLGVKGCIHDGWLYFKNIDEKVVDRDYFYYFVNTLSGYFKNISYGAAIQNINTPLVKRTKVVLPEIGTQRKIAEILSAYDALIENNNKRIKILEQMAENLYKEWFVRFRFPGHEKAEFEHRIPKGWTQTKMGDFSTYSRGVSYSSEEIDCEDGYNLINLKNIQGYGGFRKDGTKKYCGKYKDVQAVEKGDLIMGVTDMTQDRRTVGAVALVPYIVGESVISADLIKINSKVENIFLYSLFRFGFYSNKTFPNRRTIG